MYLNGEVYVCVRAQEGVYSELHIAKRLPTALMCADVASRENMGLIRSTHESHSYQHDTSLSGRKETACCPSPPLYFIREDTLMAYSLVCPPPRNFEPVELFL